MVSRLANSGAFILLVMFMTGCFQPVYDHVINQGRVIDPL